MAKGTPIIGDRSAFDSTNNPELHASDLAANTPVNHVVAGTAPGDVPIWDGTKWVPSNSLAGGDADTLDGLESTAFALTHHPHEHLVNIGFTDPIAAGQKSMRIYNRSSNMDFYFLQVFAAVQVAPTGDPIIIDVHIGDNNGNQSIFSGNQANRPRILATELEGYSATFDSPTPYWNNGEWIEVHIDGVGSGERGQNLVVCLLLNEPVYLEG